MEKQLDLHAEKITQAKRIVVKVGTSTLTYENGQFNLRRIDTITRVLSDLKNQGKEIVLVSSGAICAGTTKLGLKSRPDTPKAKQAVAAVGQVELMSIYGKLFGQYSHTVSQILITRDVVEQQQRKENVVNTFEELFSMGVLPIVNENDSVSVEQILYGDNDTLSAVVAKLIGADLLIIMSDIDGLYDRNPNESEHATLIPVVEKIDDSILASASGTLNKFGTGGMTTKISAGQIATEAGADMIILNGKNPKILYKVFDGKQVGTLFLSEERRA